MNESEREWGIFYFENKTKLPLLWSIKGLHLAVNKKIKKLKNSVGKKT
jgi:hypothetical protein